MKTLIFTNRIDSRSANYLMLAATYLTSNTIDLSDITFISSYSAELIQSRMDKNLKTILNEYVLSTLEMIRKNKSK